MSNKIFRAGKKENHKEYAKIRIRKFEIEVDIKAFKAKTRIVRRNLWVKQKYVTAK